MPVREHTLSRGHLAAKNAIRLRIDRFFARPLCDSFGLSIESDLGSDEISETLLQAEHQEELRGLLKKFRVLVLNRDVIPTRSLRARGGMFLQEQGQLRNQDPAIDHAFWFWHFDEIKNGITHLHSTDHDYHGASETVFYDISNATKHLVEILPEFIENLAKPSFRPHEAPATVATPDSGRDAKRLLDEAYQEWLHLGHFIIEQPEHLHILQKASIAFQHLLLTHGPGIAGERIHDQYMRVYE